MLYLFAAILHINLVVIQTQKISKINIYTLGSNIEYDVLSEVYVFKGANFPSFSYFHGK